MPNHNSNQHPPPFSRADADFAVSRLQDDIDKIKREEDDTIRKLELRTDELRKEVISNFLYQKAKFGHTVQETNWNWLLTEWEKLASTMSDDDWKRWEEVFPRDMWPAHIEWGNLVLLGKFEKERFERGEGSWWSRTK